MAESEDETEFSVLNNTSSEEEQIPNTRKRRRRYKKRFLDSKPCAKLIKDVHLPSYVSDTSDDEDTFRGNPFKLRRLAALKDNNVEGSAAEQEYDVDGNNVSDLQSSPSGRETTTFTYSSTDHTSPSSTEDGGDDPTESTVIDGMHPESYYPSAQSEMDDGYWHTNQEPAFDMPYLWNSYSSPSGRDTPIYTYSSTDHTSPSSTEDGGDDSQESAALEEREVFYPPVETEMDVENRQPNPEDNFGYTFISNQELSSWNSECVNSDFMYPPTDCYPDAHTTPFALGDFSDEAKKPTLSEETKKDTDSGGPSNSSVTSISSNSSL